MCVFGRGGYRRAPSTLKLLHHRPLLLRRHVDGLRHAVNLGPGPGAFLLEGAPLSCLGFLLGASRRLLSLGSLASLPLLFLAGGLLLRGGRRLLARLLLLALLLPVRLCCAIVSNSDQSE